MRHGELFQRRVHRPLLDRTENPVCSVSVPRQSIRRTLRPSRFHTPHRS